MHRWAQFTVAFCTSALVAAIAIEPRTASAVYALNSPLGCVPSAGNTVSYISGIVCTTGTSQLSTAVICPYDDDEDLHQSAVTSVGVTGLDNSASGTTTAQACVAPQLVYGLAGSCGPQVNNGGVGVTGPFSLTPPHAGKWGGAFGLQSVYVSVGLPAGPVSCVHSIIVNG